MIDIQLDDSQVRQLFQRLGRKMRDFSPVMREIAGVMADAVEENFARQGRPPWRPLAESTIERREKLGYWPGKILQMTGQLARSIQSEHGKDYAAVGTNLIYAAIHQFGGKAGRGGKVEIPARPFLELGEDDQREIIQILKKYLSG